MIPFLPIASDKLSLLTIQVASFFLGLVINTSTSLAGLRAFFMNVIGSLSYKITSIFSLPICFKTLFILEPFAPITQPTASTFSTSL